MYKLSYTTQGILDAINRESDGVSLPFYPATKTFDELDPLVVELRQWEASHEVLDLSDREPDPEIIEIVSQVLTTENANAIHITYSPTPENSVLTGKKVQSALDDAIISIAELRAALNSVIANNKPPIFYDALNDINNKSLDQHTPNTPYNGGVWQEIVGDWSIVSNQAKANGVSGSLAVYDCGFGGKGSFEADVTIGNVSTPQGIIFRYASNTSYWRAVYSSSGGGKWMLQEIQGSGTSTRQSAPATVVFGQTYKFKILLDNNNISFLIDDRTVCNWTATTNLVATKFGFYASSSTGTLFKNAKAVNLS